MRKSDDESTLGKQNATADRTTTIRKLHGEARLKTNWETKLGTQIQKEALGRKFGKQLSKNLLGATGVPVRAEPPSKANREESLAKLGGVPAEATRREDGE